jgi:hypothetical protein
VNNGYADATYTVGRTNLSERVDYVISDKQRLFARYSYLIRDQRPITLIR